MDGAPEDDGVVRPWVTDVVGRPELHVEAGVDRWLRETGVVHIAIDRRSVMAAWRASGTMADTVRGYAPTGRVVRFAGTDTHWFADGRLVRVRTVYDMLDFSRQMGALPPLGSRWERAGVVLQRMTARRMRKRPPDQSPVG